MANERSKDNSSEELFSDKPLKVIEKLGFSVLKLEEIDENIIKTFKENNEDFLASFSNKNPDESLPYYSNIKVVVGLDFGTTYKRLKPRLPVDHKKAITDYLREIGKVIKDKIAWSVNFFENVLLVLSVPAEYSEKDKSIMRKCAYNAGLINVKNSKNLEFITESEAAAIYCMNNKLNELQEYNLGMTLMVVDCGGYTVDLTTRKLVGINPLRLDLELEL
ncbi:unnamed protein product [Rhizophagus irregularis]|nr:unnamed protein product [Rhizophagus irregularis]